MHIFMENKRLSKVSSEHHLPEELCRDILSRLPVKSLLRFRCVSKSWLSLINDPDFGLVHLENFKNNRDETHLLVVEGKPKHCVIRCSDTFETNRETLVTLPPRYREVDWTVKCSVNGLVLLQTRYRRDSSARANDLMVWNPSIRKFHAIPSLPESETSPNSSFQEVDIGMGYDPLVKDYKHVKLIRGNANILPLVAIYTIGDDSWKMSQFQGKEFSSFEWDFGSIHRDVVYLRGSLYFLATNREGEVLGLVSFDLTCEEFCSVSLPEYEEGVRLVRYGCSSLAMFFMEEYVFMWVLEIESMCWTKRYSLHLLVPDELLYLKKNRDMLMWWSQNLVEFSVATSDSFRQWCQLVTSYNLESKEEKIKLLEKQDDDFDIWGVYGYIESLALLK